MSDNVLQKYTGRSGAAGEAAEVSDADGTEDLGAFGWLRGPRDRSIMLELRKRDGNIMAIGYGFIDKIALDPSEGISLHCGELTIHIRGRNLNAEVRPQVRLFQGLTRHRVSWLAEIGKTDQLRTATDAIVVQSIEW